MSDTTANLKKTIPAVCYPLLPLCAVAALLYYPLLLVVFLVWVPVCSAVLLLMMIPVGILHLTCNVFDWELPSWSIHVPRRFLRHPLTYMLALVVHDCRVHHDWEYRRSYRGNYYFSNINNSNFDRERIEKTLTELDYQKNKR